MKRPGFSLSLSLSLSIGLLSILIAAPCDAAKVTLEKEEIFSSDGVLLGFRDFPAPVLATLGVALIADYPSYVAGEVADSRVAAFEQAASDLGISFALHPEWDVISMNGYTFPSSGPPEGLPPDLQIAGFDGETGLYLVQLKAPLAAGWWARVTAVAEVVGYYPWNTYLLRFPPAALPTVRALDVVQHCSPYQPAYKISPGIPDSDEPIEMVVELDAEQDLTDVTALLGSFGGSAVDVTRVGSRGYVQVAVDRASLRTLAHRTEVLWMEPQYGIELSGERDATIVAGQYDGNSPPQQPVRYPEDTGVHDGGHDGWLLDKGFCTPTGGQQDCMVYWTKVGVVDTGLDLTSCAEEDYDELTGICSDWYPTNRRHPDLNHGSNLEANCPPAGQGIEDNADCVEPVVYSRAYCSHAAAGNQCFEDTLYEDYYNFSDTGLLAPIHGTSVASIIVGDPLNIIPGDPDPPERDGDENDPNSVHYYRGSGIAPSAQIVIAKFTDAGSNSMTHVDWAELVERVNRLGSSDPDWLGEVRFANNSWNLDDDMYFTHLRTQYTFFSAMADLIVRDASRPQEEPNGLQEMTLVFSAGNCPPDESDCLTTSPGNAKNVISVGAARGWSDDDSVAHDECPAQEHNISDIAGFVDPGWHSRRRFDTEPGRFKPDLVAPGTQVAAARSRYGTPPPSDLYRCFSGTSAAAPAVTAAAILAEAWYYYTFGHVLPSPAMIRAILVTSADDLHDGYDHLVEDPLPHSPSLAQGWGRVNLDKLIPDDSPPPSLPVAVFDQDHLTAGRRFTQSGQYWSVQPQVADPGEDVIAVMVFTDLPSAGGAQNLVMNDLDLKITKVSWGGIAHTFWGNHFASGSWYSHDTGSRTPKPLPKDLHNTVEVIRVPAGVLSGTFTLRVTAAAIIGNAVPGLDGGAPNQDFALYVHNVNQ